MLQPLRRKYRPLRTKDSWKEFEGVSDEVLSEQLISRIIDIRGIVKLLGKGKLEFNCYLRL